MKIHDNQFKTPGLDLTEIGQGRYDGIISGFRGLFEASRYPNGSKDICEQWLRIRVEPQDGIFSTHALVKTIQAGYGRYAAGYNKANGFTVSWYDRLNRGGCDTLTYIDNFFYDPGTAIENSGGMQPAGLMAWLDTNEARAKEVQQILHEALRDESLNPKTSAAARRLGVVATHVGASLQPDTLLR